MKINVKFIIIVMLLMILLSFNVFGFAVTSYYWDKKPLYLNPGESIEIQAFGLQNMVGNKDITLKVSQDSGFEIAEIIDESLEYKVPFGRKDVYVNMKVTIPPDTNPGTYNIGASFKEIAIEKKSGTVQFVMGMTNNIVVVVKGEEIEEEIIREIPLPTVEEKVSDKRYLGIVILAVIIILAIFSLYKNKSKKKGKKKK